MTNGPTVVVFGAGAIGRGLLGELVRAAGLDLVLVEANPLLVEALRRQGHYQVRLVGVSTQVREVAGFRVLHSRETAAVTDAVAQAGFAATAVGGANLALVAPLLASGLAARATPLNILVCENAADGESLLSGALGQAGAGSFHAVRCSVERMVRSEPGNLDLVGEAAQGVYVDAAGWHGPQPTVSGMEFRADLSALCARKLFTNNAGHALLAYEGFLIGCATVCEALAKAEIRSRLEALLALAARMLECEHGSSAQEHVDDLLRHRFANTALADRVARVARQPLRKLGPQERLVSLLRRLQRHRLPPQTVCRTIAAAMRYDDPSDDESRRLQDMIRRGGPGRVLVETCRMKPEEECYRLCLAESAAIATRRGEHIPWGSTACFSTPRS